MGLLDTYQEGTDTALQFMQDRPLEQPKPKPKHSGWTTLPRAITAGAAEAVGNLSDVLGASAGATAAFGLSEDPFKIPTDEERKNRLEQIQNFQINFRPEQSKPVYEFSDSLRIDPDTATFSENLFFGLTRGLTKAVGSVATAGPIGGAAMFGVSEGMTESELLAQQGVDLETRMQVGAVSGVVNTASALIPVAGQTVGRTAALAFTGGPGAFMAQQKITSDILSKANYPDIAQQYDPLDPVGLAIAALIPAGLGVHAMKATSRATARQNIKPDTNAPDVAEVQPAAQDAQPAPVKTQNFESQENIDVAMVQNLTIQRDIADNVATKFQEDISAAANKLTPQESRSLKQEQAQLEHSIEFEQGRADATFKQLAKDSQATGLSRKEAEAAARKTLMEADVLRTQRLATVNERLNTHQMAMQADERLNRLSNGASALDVYGIRSEVPETSLAGERIEEASLTDQIIRTTEQANASRTAKSEPLKPADKEPTAIKQTIDRFIAEQPDMEVSVREDGSRVKLADEVEYVRREIENGTDDELGTRDAQLVQAAIQCFLGG